MESFCALSQNNALDRRSRATREDIRVGIVAWSQRTYHRR